jgi:hypothetical protein
MNMLIKLHDSKKSPEFEIDKQAKGLKISFFGDYVFKQWNLVPSLYSVEERDNRFQKELNAYKKFQLAKCSFVPELLDYSEENNILCIQKIMGKDLLTVLQNFGEYAVSYRDIISQIEYMDEWLHAHRIHDLGTSYLDLILADEGSLYLIDFERFEGETAVGYRLIDKLMANSLHRIFFRRGKDEKLTLSFLFLSLRVFLKRPSRLPTMINEEVIHRLRHKMRVRKELLKSWVKGLAGYSPKNN